MSDIQMPALGESVTEGTVTRWLKQVGDEVAVDEPLVEISTDKVDTEIPSPVAGTLLEIVAGEDETVEVGGLLARIGSPEEAGGAATPEPAQQQEVAPAPGAQAEDAPAAAQEEPPVSQEEPPVSQEEAPAQEAPAQEAPAQQAPTEEAPTEEAPTEEAPAQPAGSGDGPSEEVPLPALGESVTEGTVTRWLKQVGDDVAVDEPLVEISTDKVDTEVPSPVAGKLLEILVGEDETVAVGTPLARIGSGAAAPPAQAPPAQEAPAREAPAPTPRPREEPRPPETDSEEQASLATAVVPEAPAQQQAEPVSQRERPAPAAPSASSPAAPEHPQPPAGGYLTPLVRKLAAEKGVDLSQVDGSGVGGRIRKDDVLQAAERATQQREQAPPPQAPPPARAPAQPVSPLRGTTEKASRLRQIIASRMHEAMQTMAQLTTVVEVDMTRVARLRTRAKEDFKAREGVNLSFLPFFVLAATEALKAHPKINGLLEGNQITYHGEENVGIAVDTDRGLVVPVIRSAGDLNLAGIARKIADLADRTRANKVTPDELSGATFTVTNTGWGGAVFDTPIVPVGTSAILGTGAIIKRPVVAIDETGSEYIAIRSMCYLALSYDHRLVDGADAARYLATVKERLEEGDFTSELGL